MMLRQLEYLIHGDILPMSINKYRISERLVLQRVFGDGYRDSTWGEHVDHVKAYIGVESDGTPAYFTQAQKYLTLFLHLYTLQSGQPYIVFRPLGTPIDDFEKLGEKSFSYPNHKPIEMIGKSLDSDVIKISKLKNLFQYVEYDFVSIIDSPLGLAMQFFYDAVMSNHRWSLELAIVHFMMAAEVLIIVGEESKRQSVSKRIGVLYSNSNEEYEKVYKNMKKLYGVRNGIVHGGGKKASHQDVSLSYQYLQKSILERLALRHIPKNELVMKLDEISMDWGIKSNLTDFRLFDLTK